MIIKRYRSLAYYLNHQYIKQQISKSGTKLGDSYVISYPIKIYTGFYLRRMGVEL